LICAPELIDATGVGPVSAAQALISWSHRGRCCDDAAFAALAGACPLPASSGRVVRHRLNRGGDRQLNRALHDILLTRWRICPRTHAYIARRRAEGKTDPRSAAASSGTSPENSSAQCKPPQHLTPHRSVRRYRLLVDSVRRRLLDACSLLSSDRGCVRTSGAVRWVRLPGWLPSHRCRPSHY
jgi:hypothetical protein